MEDKIRVMLSEEELDRRIRELGAQISADYEGESIFLVCILKGAAMFACELAKRITVPVVMDFMATSRYGAGTVLLELVDQYYNMLSQLSDKPHITDIARQAIEEACGFCKIIPIRGGTDGAQLSFKGLPCPNIFAGGLNFHGRHEFVPVQSMEKAMQTVINICRITAERY